LCLAGAVGGALIGAFDVIVRGLPRAEGFFGGSNLMPRTAIVLGFAALGGVFIVRGPGRLVLYLGPLAAAIATYYSGSRGAALAIPFLALLACVFLALASDTRRHLVVFAILTAAAVGGILLVGDSTVLIDRFVSIPGTVAELMSKGTSTDHSTSVRMETNLVALSAFLMSPWIGWGWGNMALAAANIDPSLVSAPGQNFFFHADVANFAVAAGAAGLAALLAILVAPTIGALASPRDDLFRVRLYLALVLAFSYAIFGLTDFTLGYDLPTTLFAFIAVAAASSLSRKET
jgi:O-antigen ligase